MDRSGGSLVNEPGTLTRPSRGTDERGGIVLRFIEVEAKRGPRTISAKRLGLTRSTFDVVEAVVAHRSYPDSIPISWELTVSIVSSDALGSLNCTGCQTPLDLHQPDEENPARLLGICGRCSSWFLLEIGSRGTKVQMFRLPDGAVVREKLAEARKAGRSVPHATHLSS